jgi:hypothetical protein
MYKKSLADSLTKNRNTKKWWTTVKWLLGKGGDSSYSPLNYQNKQITGNKDKAEIFNSFFLSHSNINVANAHLPDDINFPEILDSISATEEEVCDLLKNIDTSKATGSDGISPKLLHEAGQSIVPSLTKLINLSLQTSTVPSIWKLANVLPLFKKGDKCDTNNYRPVSLLSCVSKILERVVFKHLYNYVKENGLLSPHQSGFQTGDSTVNQLSFLYHTFCEALDKKKDVHIVFCDISKAFDRVWHEGLIYKLQKIGICGTLLLWFKDYLRNRMQKVIIRGQQSETGIIKAGVPQGSVLGPLLFLIYINDLADTVTSKIKLFADDTTLYIEFDNPNTASQGMNDNLTSVQQWADQWLVKFSPPKTKLMTCSYKKATYPPIKFNNVALASVNSHRHLGLTLSSNLTWSEHINSLLKSISPMSDVLRKLKYTLDRKSLETIYFSFIRPKLEYASHIWDNCSQHDSLELEKFQINIARIVTGARKGTSHELLYNETNWCTLAERRQSSKLKCFIKIVNNEAPSYLGGLLPPKIGLNRPASRNAEHFCIPKCRTQTYQSSFIPSAIKMWNNCAPEQRTIEYAIKNMSKESHLLYYLGDRSTNVKHAQLRMQCSKLNAHLFSLHVVDSPQCTCGYNMEDNKHYLLNCPLYTLPRVKMLQSIQNIGINVLHVDTLLYGINEIDYSSNKDIFKAVHIFIEETERL